MDEVRLDHQILIDKFRRIGVICVDATNFGSRHDDIVDRLVLEKLSNGTLITEIKFCPCAGNDVLKPM